MTTSYDSLALFRKLLNSSLPISSEGFGGIGPAGIAQRFSSGVEKTISSFFERLFKRVLIPAEFGKSKIL